MLQKSCCTYLLNHIANYVTEANVGYYESLVSLSPDQAASFPTNKKYLTSIIPRMLNFNLERLIGNIIMVMFNLGLI